MHISYSSASYVSFWQGGASGNFQPTPLSPNSDVENTPRETIWKSKDDSFTEQSGISQKNSDSGIREFDKLSQAEQRSVNELKQKDTQVRTHEMAHLSAAGSLASSGPTYDYQKGPDGKKYAIGGEIHIDTSALSGDPEATLQKMEKVKRAALAPADPSGQDRRVAAKAAATAAKARTELLQIQMKGKTDKKESLDRRLPRQAADYYESMSKLSQANTSSFSLVV